VNLLDSETRKSKIRDAVSKVLSADIGAFCNVSEKKTGKIMIVIENSSKPGKAVVSVQGELTDEQIAKAKEIVESLGGDSLQLIMELPKEQIPEATDKILSELLGTEEFDIEIELVVE